jgi:TRAP-type transport system periplasmic protein
VRSGAIVVPDCRGTRVRVGGAACVVLAVACALVVGCASGDAAQTAPIRLRYASPYSPLHPFSRADSAWMKHVEARSDGRLRIEPHWSGALVSADQSLVELRHGVADVGVITPIYARGGAHALRAQAGFYAGAHSFAQQVAVYKCLAREFDVFADELRGLRILAVQGGNLPGIVTRAKPVHRIADLKGLRLRAPSELLEVLRTLGADPVNMPMGEVYSAMAKGIIDGVVVSADALRALHLAEVGRYYASLSIPRGGYPARAIAERALVRLPEGLQRILLESGAFWERALAEELTRAREAGEQLGRAEGVTFASLPPHEQQQFDAVYQAAAQKSAERLVARGVDGLTMFARAQHWTRCLQTRSASDGSPLPCL